jgi:hypothetical protein
VSDVLFLDSGPLGLITQPQRSHEVIAITDWLKDCFRADARILVPAIVYYEIKRELLRANKVVGIARLEAFVDATPDRYADRWKNQNGRHESSASRFALGILFIRWPRPGARRQAPSR